jgi:cytidylate kinase
MAAITISRQLGSGGASVARLVASELGYRVVDRDLVDAIAARAGVSVSTARSLDEQADNWAGGFIRSLLLGIQGQQITQESYTYIAAQVIRQAVDTENVVILGRGGQVVLGLTPGTFHVHIVAPERDRIARVSSRDGITPDQARKRMHESDAARRRYVSLAGQREWDDPLIYDLVVNTHRLSVETVAGIIVDAARRAGTIGHRPPR